MLRRMRFEHPVFTDATLAAQKRLWSLQGVGDIWFSAPISVSASMKTGCRPASRSPRRSAACAAHGRSKGKAIVFSSVLSAAAPWCVWPPRHDRAGLYVGSVMHRRSRPVRRRFEYRVFWLVLDLDRLGETASALKLMSLERFNLMSFYARDHADGLATARCATRSRRWRQRLGSPPTGRCCS